ncbi:MAG TPA: hypothetical protein VMT64_16205, partial [Candidatus Binataceae bacterium]|nr:hypothetical protein [Candidatus Binataceae bacterium]
MKRVVRIAALLAILGILMLSVAIPVLYYNQQRIVNAVLATVRKQTGIDIVPSASRILVRRHLVVELDNPRVSSGGREIVSARQVVATVNFRSVFTHGLPLRELDVYKPAIKLPFDVNAAGAAPIPRPDRELVDETMRRLGDLAAISRKFVITGLDLRDQSGTPLLSDAHLVASHSRVTPKLWGANFVAHSDFPNTKGARIAGKFKVGESGLLPETDVLQGTFWFWQLPMQHLTLGNLEADGQSKGAITFSIARDGVIAGETTLGLNAFTIRSPDLSSPLELGDYSLQSQFTTSLAEVAISNVRVTHNGEPVVAANASIAQPYAPNPRVAIGIAELKLAWKDVLDSARALKRLPQELEFVMRRVKSAQLQIQKASVDCPLMVLESMSPESIIANLSVSATLKELSFAPPAETRLPEVKDASAKILFAKRILWLLQGTAKIGNSGLHEFEAKIDLSKSLEQVPYKFSAQADLDLGELHPATVKMLDSLNVHERDRLQQVRGIAELDLNASGTFRKASITRPPENYLIKVEPRNVEIVFRGAPGPIGFSSGAMTVQPDLVKLEKIIAHATGGTADFDGELHIDGDGVQTRGLKIGMHQMPIERWLEGVVDPDDFSAQGNLGGELVITGDRTNGFLANGKITLQSGQIRFGFLRSPMIVHPAILTIRDRTLTVSLPAAEFEKSPVDFSIAVADLRTPSIRIDANVQKFDVEAMNFVRLPWMPPTPTHPPKIPISGHIEAREANLESFTMKNAK